MNHQGRLAVVTGASRGIGQAIALRLADDGARVANLDIASGRQTEALAHSAGATLRSYACDLADAGAIASALQQVERDLGPCGILVHCAAALFLKPFDELTAPEWRLTQAVNQEAPFHLLKAVLPAMRAAQWGRVVFITSSTFWVGGQGMTHYVASKGGLMGFAHGLAAEVGGDGITVNCIAPGLTRTPQVAASLPEAFFRDIAAAQSIPRNGTPADQAGAVSFLASDDAAFITGQTLVVDGGQVRS